VHLGLVPIGILGRIRSGVTNLPARQPCSCISERKFVPASHCDDPLTREHMCRAFASRTSRGPNCDMPMIILSSSPFRVAYTVTWPCGVVS
jgi:hypothetical protein